MGFNLKWDLINIEIKVLLAQNSLRKNIFGMCEGIYANKRGKTVGRNLPPYPPLVPTTWNEILDHIPYIFFINWI